MLCWNMGFGTIASGLGEITTSTRDSFAFATIFCHICGLLLPSYMRTTKWWRYPSIACVSEKGGTLMQGLCSMLGQLLPHHTLTASLGMYTIVESRL